MARHEIPRDQKKASMPSVQSSSRYIRDARMKITEVHNSDGPSLHLELAKPQECLV